MGEALPPFFSRLTNLFFSTLPDNYEESFWDEIWGCVNYIKLPYETVMSMPVRERKIWIQKHNFEQQRLKEDMDSKDSKGLSSMTGEGLNTYAKLSQEKIKNGVAD